MPTSFFYILFSASANKYYTGITSTTVAERIHKHNAGFYDKHFTSIASDWELKLEIEFVDFSLARKAELYIKRMKSRNFIEKLIGNSDEVEKFKNIINSN